MVHHDDDDYYDDDVDRDDDFEGHDDYVDMSRSISGHGDSSSKSVPTLVKNIGLVGQVACGSSHTIALSQDGTSVWSFGAGDSGG